MYLISGWYAVSQYCCCWTYVSSLTIPASSTAKSPACEDGNLSATKSSKLPVKPGSPCQVGHDAIARVTDVWNSRTCETVGVEPLDLDEHRAGVAVEGRVGREVELHLDVAELAFLEIGHAVGAVLGPREQHAVVAGLAVVLAVVDVGVEAVLVGAGERVLHRHVHLLRAG